MDEKKESSADASALWRSISPTELIAWFPGDQQTLKSSSTVPINTVVVPDD